jgi:hypothetical protein
MKEFLGKTCFLMLFCFKLTYTGCIQNLKFNIVYFILIVHTHCRMNEWILIYERILGENMLLDVILF